MILVRSCDCLLYEILEDVTPTGGAKSGQIIPRPRSVVSHDCQNQTIKALEGRSRFRSRCKCQMDRVQTRSYNKS